MHGVAGDHEIRLLVVVISYNRTACETLRLGIEIRAEGQEIATGDNKATIPREAYTISWHRTPPETVACVGSWLP